MKISNSPRSRSRFLLPALGGLALVGVAGMAFAKPAVQGPGAQGKRGGLCAKLECTDTQKDELKEVMTELRTDAKGDREAVKRLNGQLAAEFAKASPDEKAMRSLQGQIASHHQQMQDRAFDAMMEVHGLLDAEQRGQLATMMEHRGMRALMGGKGRRGGKGKRGEGKRKAGN